MPIPDNLKTPNVYFDVNTDTQRTGLPANLHKVLFITDDAQSGNSTLPKSIYDKAQADAIFGQNSMMGRMLTAAIKTNRIVNVQGFGEVSTSPSIGCEGATSKILFEPAPLFDGEIDWSIEFDGVAYPLGKVNGNEILTALPSTMKNKIFTDWDGFWVLENKDVLPHRFKLTPSSKPEIDPIQATWTEQNQSFTLNNDGSFIFCLAKSCTPTLIEIEDKGMDLPSNSFVSLTYSLSIPSKNIEIVNKTILVNAQENGTAPVFEEAIRQILDNAVQIIGGGGGVGHFQHYRTWLHGGDGSGILSDVKEVTITLHNTNTPNPRADLMNFLQMYGETQYFSQIAPVVIHSCGSQSFAGL
ncbi:hypothetical protein I9054_012195 [Acinetobacter bereziniae]|uniref:Uncharacterized protein n=1 Tax=Acinetobacter bereziniae TaxID=106648 RepID=A0A9E7TEM6_ACIBZ|nr:hypothetical protein [Acinetobacter bereziniae]UUN96146.1 hypothetical protein I9054_012195 [Acinetobacter bereziniae]